MREWFEVGGGEGEGAGGALAGRFHSAGEYHAEKIPCCCRVAISLMLNDAF